MAIINLVIDLGSANTTIYKSGEGIVLHEPSLVLVKGNSVESGRIVEFGQQARNMVGKLLPNQQLLYPIQEGAITYKKATRAMLVHFLNKVINRSEYFLKPKVRAFVNVPCGSMQEERYLIEEVLNSIGIAEVYMLEAPLFSAFGANLPISDDSPIFIADIGGGITDVALINSSGIQKGYSFGIGGMGIDRGIVDGLASSINLKVGIITAEEIKKSVGSLYEHECNQISVFGKNASTGNATPGNVHSRNIYPMLDYFYGTICNAIKTVLKEFDAEMLHYISDHGIVITGGCAKLPGLAEYFESKLKMKVIVPQSPEFSAVVGGAKLIDNGEVMNKLLQIK